MIGSIESVAEWGKMGKCEGLLMGLIHFSLIGVGMIWLIPRDTALYFYNLASYGYDKAMQYEQSSNFRKR
ncbi:MULTISPECIES: hypothetical protein [Photorhabdus]|uniref:hypothetical protein n=1 Tax=Photorhabdus TaxID=29487 RepID=UPI0021D4DC78|nr:MULTISPECIES: hypothetical protein [Photorhabdus]MCT8353584.1 hypothetical protein [Photorhabdus kayaii]MDB6368515.1 hypothetical protein [Photorhabdus bodei]